MATEKKLYTLADVAVHNNANDCWLVIDGQVREHHRSFGALSAPVFLRRSCLLSPSSILGVVAIEVFSSVSGAYIFSPPLKLLFLLLSSCSLSLFRR
jgi:hypothetical protein